jgi:hypothetical protein
MKLSEVLSLSDEEFDCYVVKLLERKKTNPFKNLEGVRPIQAKRFENLCSEYLGPQMTDGIILQGRVIA